MYFIPCIIKQRLVQIRGKTWQFWQKTTKDQWLIEQPRPITDKLINNNTNNENKTGSGTR
jgi:hypothetical protein